MVGGNETAILESVKESHLSVLVGVITKRETAQEPQEIQANGDIDKATCAGLYHANCLPGTVCIVQHYQFSLNKISMYRYKMSKRIFMGVSILSCV